MSYDANNRFDPGTAFWMCLAFSAALGLAAIALAVAGANERGIDIALKATARLSFLIFFLAYAGSSLATLFGENFRFLGRRAREFGLAFGAAMLVHLGLVIRLCLIGDAPSVSTFVFFGGGLVWTYLLVLFSIDHMREMLGQKWWRLLRMVGMNYIIVAFAFDFIHPFHGGRKQTLVYLPFAILAVGAPILRLAAILMAGRRISRHPGTIGV